MNEYMTVKEASMKWCVSERLVQEICREGRIDGVAKLGRNWLIPANSEKPKDNRVTSGRYKNWRKQRQNIDVADVW